MNDLLVYDINENVRLIESKQNTNSCFYCCFRCNSTEKIHRVLLSTKLAQPSCTAAAAVHGVEFVLHSDPAQQLCDLLCASERKVCCLRVIKQSCVSDRVQSVRLCNKD